MSAPDNRPLSRKTADQVIQRALQLDAERADGLTEAQIRDIAAELSVSTTSVDQALAEQRAGASHVDMPATNAPRQATKWFSRATAMVSTIVILLLVSAVITRLFP